MITINFSENWNKKLNCKAFTTLRLASPKYQIGTKVQVNLKGAPFPSLAVIIDKREILLRDVNEYIARLDTGYSAEQCQKLIRTMYKNSGINWDTQKLAFVLIAYNNEPSATSLVMDI